MMQARNSKKTMRDAGKGHKQLSKMVLKEAWTLGRLTSKWLGDKWKAF